MSFAERVGNIFGGLRDGGAEIAGLVADLATIPLEAITGLNTSTVVDDDVSGFAALGELAEVRVPNLLEQVFGPERGVGAAVGALPEGFRDEARGPVEAVGGFFDAAQRELVAEPLGALGVAAGLAEAEGDGPLDQVRRMFLADTWRRAEWVVDEKNAERWSPAQALAMVFATEDITDPHEVARVWGSDWFSYVTGTTDALIQVGLDPTVLGGRLNRGATAAVLADNPRFAARAAGTLERIARRRGITARIVNHVVRGSSERRTGVINLVRRLDPESAVAARMDESVGFMRARREGYLRGGLGGAADRRLSPDDLRELAGAGRREVRRALRPVEQNWALHRSMIERIDAEASVGLLDEDRAAFAEIDAGLAERIDGLDSEIRDLLAREDSLASAVDPTPAQRAELSDVRDVLRRRGAQRAGAAEERELARLRTIDDPDRARAALGEMAEELSEKADLAVAIGAEADVARGRMEAAATMRNLLDEDRAVARLLRDRMGEELRGERKALTAEVMENRRRTRTAERELSAAEEAAGEAVPVAEALTTAGAEVLVRAERELSGLLEDLTGAQRVSEAVGQYGLWASMSRVLTPGDPPAGLERRVADALEAAEDARREVARVAGEVSESGASQRALRELNDAIADADEAAGRASELRRRFDQPDADFDGDPAWQRIAGASEANRELIARKAARVEQLLEMVDRAIVGGFELPSEALSEIDELIEAARKGVDEAAKASRATGTVSAVRLASGAAEMARVRQYIDWVGAERRRIADLADAERRRLARLRDAQRGLEVSGDRLHTRMVTLREAFEVRDLRKARRAGQRIGELLFPRDPFRDQKGYLLALAGGELREQAVRFLMGDQDAIRDLWKMRDEMWSAAEGVVASPGLVRRSTREAIGAADLGDDVMTRMLGEEYAARARSPHIQLKAAERIDRATALIDAMAEFKRQTGAVEIVRDPELDAMARWEAVNNLDVVERIDGAVRHQERLAGWFRMLEGRGLAGSILGTPRAQTNAALREGLEHGRTGQMSTVFAAGGTSRQRIVYDAARAASRWAHPENPSAVRRLVTMPVRGALSTVEYAMARKPPARVRIDDPGGDAERALLNMGRSWRIDADWLAERVSAFTESAGVERKNIWDEVQARGFRDAAARNFGEDVADEFVEEFRRRFASAEEAIRKKEKVYAVHTTHVDPDADAIVHAIDHPVLRSQEPLFAHAVDGVWVERKMEKWARSIQRGRDGELVVLAADARRFFEAAHSAWKVTRLLRPSWTTRVVFGDETLRMMTRFHSVVRVIAQVVKASPLVGGAVYGRFAQGAERLGVGQVGFGRAITAATAGAGMLAAGPVGLGVGLGAGAAANKLGLRLARRFDEIGRDVGHIRFGDLEIERALPTNSERGRRMIDAVSAGESVTQFADRGFSRLGDRATVPNHPNPGGMGVSDEVRRVTADHHLREWADVLNRQIGSDEGALKYLELHLDDADHAPGRFRRWMTRSTEGRQYARDTGIAGRDELDFSRERIDEIVQFVDDYVGVHHPDADEIIRKVADQSVTPEDLDGWFPDVDARPVIHGDEVRVGLSGAFRGAIGEIVETLLDAYGTIPTDLWSRQPVFREFYHEEMARRLSARGWSPGSSTTIPTRELRDMEEGARRYALGMARELMYDVSDHTQLHHLFRFASPFITAQQEVLQRWMQLAWTDPDRVALLYAAWDSAVDEWTRTNEFGDEEFVVRFPGWADPRKLAGRAFGWTLVDGDADGEISIPKNAFAMNPVTGGVESVTGMGVGPAFSIPLSEMVERYPMLADEMEWLMPWGPQGLADQIIPSYVRRTFPEAFDRDRHNRVVRQITETRLTRMKLGLEEPIDFNDPEEWERFESTVASQARAFSFVTGLLNSTTPAPVAFAGMFAEQEADLNELRERFPDDPARVEAEFFNMHGEEMATLLEGWAESNRGIPANPASLAEYERLQPFIDANPRIASAVLAQDRTLDIPDLEFSSAIRDHLMSRVDPQGEPFYEYQTPREWVASVEVADGWRAFTRIQQATDDLLDQHDLVSLNQGDAEWIREARSARLAELGERYPDWWAEYTENDFDARVELRVQMRRWMERSQEFGHTGRADVRSIDAYLTFRDAVVMELRDREVGTLTATANADLLEWVEETLHHARLADPDFSTVFARWFDRDWRSIRANDETYGEDYSVPRITTQPWETRAGAVAPS